jgi:hypothetical protein
MNQLPPLLSGSLCCACPCSFVGPFEGEGETHSMTIPLSLKHVDLERLALFNVSSE